MYNQCDKINTLITGTLYLGSAENAQSSRVPANPNVEQEMECTNTQPSTSSLSVYGIDVHEKDISTLMPQSMVNDTIVNILFE